MVLEKLKKIIAGHFGIQEEELSPQTEFIGDLGADSLDVVELIFDVEEAFSLEETDEEQVKSLVTLEDLCNYVSSKI